MTERKPWFCPTCQKHHAPHVDTCPADSTSAPLWPQPVYPAPMPWVVPDRPWWADRPWWENPICTTGTGVITGDDLVVMGTIN